MSNLKPATDQAFRLAEGPVWDAVRNRLLWVDILDGVVMQGVLDADGRIQAGPMWRSRDMIGAVAVADDGRIVVAARETIAVLRPDGSMMDGPRVIPAGARRRLNDGAIDPGGRFVVGTLSLDKPSMGETLVRWEDDGSLTVIDGDLTLSNGVAWSADGRVMYNVDTMRGVVFTREYDPVSGAAGQRHVHLRLDGGHPDGIAVDAEDHLWIAMWGAGEVRRFSPHGSPIGRLRLPAPHSSSVAFAGPDLRTLIVTTARAELTAEQLRAAPDSGRLFSARVDVPGLPVPAWSRPSTL
ncbi:SMP-30/gluconolactonase/LRE family protein [Pseudonocardia nematodicida]|uniref:SMP-30/gluconolactonase/LRE family protein n=1 Tax=Pseudonocardia nematodicida TaxID=1206997 RepID=A0ABV1KDU9_9PSEU